VCPPLSALDAPVDSSNAMLASRPFLSADISTAIAMHWTLAQVLVKAESTARLYSNDPSGFRSMSSLVGVSRENSSQ
jgi:hypothetical protein